MNIYIRYFDYEALCHNMDEMQSFLEGISDIVVTDKLLQDIADYAQSSVLFPKRYKVAARNYFIMIKTELGSLEEFHAHGKNGTQSEGEARSKSPYDEQKEGWYQCEKAFRRAVVEEKNGKRRTIYNDDSIEVLVRAISAREGHNKIVDYLRNRKDIDPRSQFPQLKEGNFRYEYKGTDVKLVERP